MYMRTFVLLLLLLGISAPVLAQSFGKAYGVVSSFTTNDETASSIANTQDGNFVVAGRRMNGTGSIDVIAMKIDNAGNPLWTGLYAFPPAPAESKALCIDQALDQNGQDDGYIVTGYYKGVYVGGQDLTRKKLLMLKLNSNGSIQWQRAIGSNINLPDNGDDLEGRYVVQTPDLGFVAVGIKTDAAQRRKFIVLTKVDATGSLVWFRSYDFAESLGGVEGWCVKQTDDDGNGQIDANDGFIITGIYDGHFALVMKVQSDGTFSWMKTYNAAFSAETGVHIEPIKLGTDGYIVTGRHQSNLFLERGADVFLLRITSTGGFIWARAIGDIVPTPPPLMPTGDEGHSVKQDNNGDFVVVGGSHSYGSAHEGILFKVDGLGSLLSAYHFGGANDDHVEDIVIASTDGSYAMAGHTASFSPGGDNDTYVVKGNAVGNLCMAIPCEPHNFPIDMKEEEHVPTVKDDISIYEPPLWWGQPEYLIATQCETPKLAPRSIDAPEQRENTGLQVYPNPLASGECTLTFTVEQSGWTELTLCNMLGNVVATPMAKYLTEGSYSLKVDSNTLPSGTYLCKLNAAGHQTTTLVVINR